MRSGTLNVPGIVGFGARGGDCARARWPAKRRAWRRCAIGCSTGLQARRRRDDGQRLAGRARLPGNLNVSFAGVDGEALLMSLRRRRGVVGRGVHRQARAVARADGARAVDGPGAGVAAVRPRPRHDGRARWTTRAAQWSSDVVTRLRAMSPVSVTVQQAAHDGDEVFRRPCCERVREPQRAGALAATATDVGTGEVGNLDAGTVTRMQVRVDAAIAIVDARFKVFGCSAAIASASFVAERLRAHDRRGAGADADGGRDAGAVRRRTRGALAARSGARRRDDWERSASAAARAAHRRTA